MARCNKCDVLAWGMQQLIYVKWFWLFCWSNLPISTALSSNMKIIMCVCTCLCMCCACVCLFVCSCGVDVVWMCFCLRMWLRPQPYRSLKEAELVEEGEEVGERFQGNTAPSSPVLDKFSDLSLLQDAFRSQQGEPECKETTNTTKPSHSTHPTLSSARSLEELRADPQHANFNYQVRSCCEVLGVTAKT